MKNMNVMVKEIGEAIYNRICLYCANNDVEMMRTPVGAMIFGSEEEIDHINGMIIEK